MRTEPSFRPSIADKARSRGLHVRLCHADVVVPSPFVQVSRRAEHNGSGTHTTKKRVDIKCWCQSVHHLSRLLLSCCSRSFELFGRHNVIPKLTCGPICDHGLGRRWQVQTAATLELSPRAGHMYQKIT